MSFLYISFLDFPLPHHSCFPTLCSKPFPTFQLTMRGKQTSSGKFTGSQKIPFLWRALPCYGRITSVPWYMVPVSFWAEQEENNHPHHPQTPTQSKVWEAEQGEQDGDVRDERLVKYRGTDQRSKYIKDIGNQVSCCQKRELQIWKRKMNPVGLDSNWRYGWENTCFFHIYG